MDDQGIASIRVPLENVEKEAILYLDDWYLLLENELLSGMGAD